MRGQPAIQLIPFFQKVAVVAATEMASSSKGDPVSSGSSIFEVFTGLLSHSTSHGEQQARTREKDGPAAAAASPFPPYFLFLPPFSFPFSQVPLLLSPFDSFWARWNTGWCEAKQLALSGFSTFPSFLWRAREGASERASIVSRSVAFMWKEAREEMKQRAGIFRNGGCDIVDGGGGGCATASEAAQSGLENLPFFLSPSCAGRLFLFFPTFQFQ